jgi:hypothetical protein
VANCATPAAAAAGGTASAWITAVGLPISSLLGHASGQTYARVADDSATSPLAYRSELRCLVGFGAREMQQHDGIGGAQASARFGTSAAKCVRIYP